MLRLQGSRGVVAEQLADEFGVSVRTIYRDVASLSAAGVPIWTESGPGGGIRLLDGWQSKLSGMTGDETSALMLLGVPSIAADLGRSDAVGSAGAKLLRSLPGPLRESARLWQDRILVDVPVGSAASTTSLRFRSSHPLCWTRVDCASPIAIASGRSNRWVWSSKPVFGIWWRG